MNILGRLALLFVVVPIVELMLLIQMGQWVGLLPTLLLVVATGVTGAWLARTEGMRVFFEFQRELAAGRLPTRSMQDGVAVLIGGAFLLTPGILTDVVGFSLLFPPTRRWLQGRARAALQRGIEDGAVTWVVMGPGGWRAGGSGRGADFGGRAGPAAGDPDGDVYQGLDRTKGIEVGGPGTGGPEPYEP